ncbi:hypothetical protein N566_12485, partial [Streptomycetaceae bacterium MP113-05]
MAGFSPTLPPPSQNSPVDRLTAVQDRLAGWISDLTTLHDLTERLARTDDLDPALREVLAAGAALVGARRGLITLTGADGLGPEHTVGLGLAAADIGQLETVPRDSASRTRLLDGLEDERAAVGPTVEAPGGGPDSAPTAADAPPPGEARTHADVRTSADDTTRTPGGAPGAPGGPIENPDDLAGAARPRLGIVHPDISSDESLAPRHREVAARLGFGASYALPLITHDGRRIGVAVWLYDEPAEPTPRQRHLVELYARCATEYLDRRQ